MQKTQKPPPLLSKSPPEFSTEDWFIIDKVLNSVAKSLRKIEMEHRQKELEEIDDQFPDVRRQQAG